jgi:hypothetical protein
LAFSALIALQMPARGQPVQYGPDLFRQSLGDLLNHFFNGKKLSYSLVHDFEDVRFQGHRLSSTFRAEHNTDTGVRRPASTPYFPWVSAH